uniref:Uncharacterized protein n=1 Tax=viral metagenome TaxID=1070528 RepID=A0A6M3J7N7_9ZZZZ
MENNTHATKLPKKALGLIRRVKREFTNHIITQDFTIPEITAKNGSIFANHDVYSTLSAGEKFMEIDLRHAYWRTAYLLGYISKRVYTAFANDKEMKLFRNIALACVIAVKYREYYRDGKLYFSITESCNQYAIMYKNIRHYIWNMIGDIGRKYPKGVIGYRVDAVYVLPEYADRVKFYFRNRSYMYRSNECEKLNEREYIMFGDEIKKL